VGVNRLRSIGRHAVTYTESDPQSLTARNDSKARRRSACRTIVSCSVSSVCSSKQLDSPLVLTLIPSASVVAVQDPQSSYAERVTGGFKRRKNRLSTPGTCCGTSGNCPVTYWPRACARGGKTGLEPRFVCKRWTTAWISIEFRSELCLAKLKYVGQRAQSSERSLVVGEER